MLFSDRLELLRWTDAGFSAGSIVMMSEHGPQVLQFLMPETMKYTRPFEAASVGLPLHVLFDLASREQTGNRCTRGWV